jgi:pimeloyl-ACP methyl ester carboxylesterase
MERVKDMEDLINHPSLKDKKIIVGGHSYGGCTAIKTASLNTSGRIVGIFGMDSWPYTIKEDIKEGKLKLKVPSIFVNTVKYMEVDYPQYDYVTSQVWKDFKTSCVEAKCHDVTMKRSSHWTCMDLGNLIVFE